MAERRVTQVCKDMDGGVVGLCGLWEIDGALSREGFTEVCQHLCTKEHSYYVEQAGRRIPVQVNPADGNIVAWLVPGGENIPLRLPEPP